MSALRTEISRAYLAADLYRSRPGIRTPYDISGKSRISQTGAGGAGYQPLSLVQKPIIWQDFCRKLHGNERN